MSKHQPSKSDSGLELEVITVIDSTRSRLLANTIIDSGIHLLHLKYSVGASVAVSFLLSVVICLLAALLNKMFSQSVPIISPLSSLMSLIAGFSFGIIKVLHDNILPPNARNLVSLALDEKGLIAIRDWFHSFLSLPKQLVASFSLAVLMVLTLVIVERNTSARFGIGGYVTMFLTIFSVGHGAYCAILIPTLARAASRERMRLFWLSPADSPGIEMASLAFAKLSMADALIATLCIIAMYWFKPWESPVAAFVSGIWLLIGLMAVSYSFLYPHYYLSKAIKAEKKRQVARIQDIITSYQERFEKLDEDDFKKLSEFIKLYDQVASAREVAVNMPALRSFLTSLVLPTLSFLGGFIDLQSLLRLKSNP